MSGNTREPATSLVEMKIALGDLPMLEAAASQGRDGHQPPGDADAEGQLEGREEADSLNMDPPAVDPVDREDFYEDPMNVDDLPTCPTTDGGIDAASVEDRPVDAEGQLEGREEAPLTGEGDA